MTVTETTIPLEPRDLYVGLLCGMYAWADDDPGPCGNYLTAPVNDTVNTDFGYEAAAVAMVLDLAALCWKEHAVTYPNEHFELAALLAKLAAGNRMNDGSELDAVGDLIVQAASTAGGVRPMLQPLFNKWRGELPLFPLAWLTLTTALNLLCRDTLPPTDTINRIADRARRQRVEPDVGTSWSR